MRRVLACVAAAVVGGCADDEPTAPGSVTGHPRAAAGPTTIPTVAADEPTTVRLLTPGEEPRRALRYRSRVGATHTLAFGSTIELAMTADGHRMFGQELVSTGKIKVQITRADAGGDLAVDVEVLDMVAPSFDPSRLGTRPENLAGKRGSFVITDRGLLVTSKMPQVESADARDMLYLPDYLFALPAEPVGVGATWEVHSSWLRNGISMENIETHRLIALDDRGGETAMQHVQHCSPQAVPDLAEFNPLAMFEVRTLASHGSGTFRFATDQVLPRVNTSEFAFETQMQISSPDMNQDVVMTMSATTRATAE